MMTMSELRRLLNTTYRRRFSYPQMNRLISNALQQPPHDRPQGAPGHRIYSFADYRRIVQYLRVGDLIGPPDTKAARELRDRIVTKLTEHHSGYVYVVDREVHWSPDPPLDVIHSGTPSTCWPAWE